MYPYRIIYDFLKSYLSNNDVYTFFIFIGINY